MIKIHSVFGWMWEENKRAKLNNQLFFYTLLKSKDKNWKLTTTLFFKKENLLIISKAEKDTCSREHLLLFDVPYSLFEKKSCPSRLRKITSFSVWNISFHTWIKKLQLLFLKMLRIKPNFKAALNLVTHPNFPPPIDSIMN